MLSHLCRGCSGVGVDISPSCIANAIGMAIEEGVAGYCTWHMLDATTPEALRSDALRNSGATVVYLYCYPTLLTKLQPLVQKLCSEGGARVVTMQYHFDNWRCSAECDQPSMRLYSSV